MAQRLAVLYPERVRRIAIAGSGSGAAPGMPGARPWKDVVLDLKAITAPVLYAGGVHDVMIDAYSSYAAVQVLPNARLLLYSDAGHAFLFQHLDTFVRQVLAFLAE